MRLEGLLRDVASGKGDTELKAEIAKLKAEIRALKVQPPLTTQLMGRANIKKSCQRLVLEQLEIENLEIHHHHRHGIHPQIHPPQA